jgi:hypothetical protein
MQKKVNETNVSMDVDTYNKIRGKLKPTDNVELTDKKPQIGGSTSSSTSMTSVTEDGVEPEAVIEPQDKATIKYLSNVKDAKTGEISKPFTIADKKYQMVRGVTPSKEVVMAVYCHDEVDENGLNIIHPADHFEEKIAKPFFARVPQPNDLPADNINTTDKELAPAIAETDYDYAGEGKGFHDKETFMDYLNLVGLEGYKHFFVNFKTGQIVAKFKTTKEMVKSGVKLGPNEDYMDIYTLKRYRFGDYFKSDVNEAAPLNPEDAGTNVSKLQSDVKKLTGLIKNKFSMYLAKLDKPIEQAQFLTAMAAQIGVPLNKLSSIIASYKDISQDGQMDKTNTLGLKAERKVITKNELTESISGKKVIKTIKVKDIK